MGEKIQTLAKLNIQNTSVEIEHNEPNSSPGEEQIHIEWNKHRLEMSKKEFIKYGLAVLIADKNLKNIKNID